MVDVQKKMNLNLIKMQECMFVKLDIWQFEKHEQERKIKADNQSRYLLL